ncbi:M20 family metallopeptidase [Nonomuraea soli]|uniref:Glutamate carboxypeptidase n=1 Tax=Nonomuraea soli TaxID=1032476 RepID=A0A7W0CFK6_9ACTN|nr:M20 family metallopeptidase [Nonomuraea soli]MBA2890102.1 glutamate carboxypeptidase [Nonomuraea soli]
MNDILSAFVRDLRTLVSIDSGSYDAAGVNKVADVMADRLGDLGFTIERTTLSPDLGDLVVGRRPGSGPRVLLLAHMDTVFGPGTAAVRPFLIQDGRAYGPGVCDDKAGLVAGLLAAALAPEAELTFCCSPDEEIGAPGSREAIEKLAREADYVLSLECARENGDLVIARKGITDVTLTVRGRAAHAGIEPERGADAALAAAHLVVGLDQLDGLAPGVTVNAGVIRAGTRPNVVAAEAVIEVEVRAHAVRDLDAALAAIDRLAARSPVPDTSVLVERAAACPPMEATPASLAMLALAADIAAELGFPLAGAATGGIGDANLASGTGTPTLDGLGPVGGGDHSDDEWLDLSSVEPRITLLASLIRRLPPTENP